MSCYHHTGHAGRRSDMEQGTSISPGGVEGVSAGLGPDASWRWPEERWRKVVNKVRAGRPLRPATWPNGAQVAVALSFDVDQETSSLRDGKTSPALLAQGEYGSRAGLPRILKMLDRHAIPASFYIPGVSALLHPEDVRAIAAAGHEVGLHGWIHE